MPYLNPIQRRAVHDLQEQLAAELSTLPAFTRDSRLSKRKQAQIEALQCEIDGYLAAECPYCGDIVIRTVDDPLVSEEEAGKEALTWEIS